MKQKFEFVDNMKCISMIGVVLWHCMLFYAGNPFWLLRAETPSSIVAFLSNYFDCCFVPFFVFASGFLFCITCQKEDRKSVDIIVGRVKRLLVPWILYGLLWLVPTYTLFDIESFGRIKGTSLLGGYKVMLLGQFADMAWFLLMLFWVSLIWCCFRFLLKKGRIWVSLFVALALVLLSHYGLANVDFYKLSQIDQYLWYFYLGTIVYCYWDMSDSYKDVKAVIAAILLVITAIILAQYCGGNFYLTVLTKSINVLGMCVLFFNTTQAGLFNGKHISRLMGWLKLHNMDVYLFQAPWIYVYFVIFYPIVGKSALACILCNFVATAISIFVICEIITFIKARKIFARK